MKPHSILLIDDEDDIREVAALSLEAIGGYEVISAAGGHAGVDLAALHQPGVILLDVMMPGFDGQSTFALLQQREDTRAIPVIFLTAKDRRWLRHLGARGIITKPFDPMALSMQVKEILGGAQC